MPARKRIDFKKLKTIRRLIEESEKHDRHACECEGCRLWWTLPVAIGKNGAFYERFPASEKKIDPLQFHHDHLVYLRLVVEGKMRPYWQVFHSKNQILARLA